MFEGIVLFLPLDGILRYPMEKVQFLPPATYFLTFLVKFLGIF